MKSLLKTFVLSSVLAIPAVSFAYRGPVVLTRDMTCEQTRQYSEKYGRVWVVAHGKDIIPLYGYVDNCPNGTIESAEYVRTLDNNHCVIGYRCLED